VPKASLADDQTQTPTQAQAQVQGEPYHVNSGEVVVAGPTTDDETVLQRLASAEVVRERIGLEEVQLMLRRVAQSGDPTELQQREPELAAALALAVAGPAVAAKPKRRRYIPS